METVEYHCSVLVALHGYLRLALRDRLKTGDHIPTYIIYIIYIDLYTCAGLTLYVHALREGERTKRNRERLILFFFYHSIARKACTKSQVRQHKGQMADTTRFPLIVRIHIRGRVRKSLAEMAKKMFIHPPPLSFSPLPPPPLTLSLSFIHNSAYSFAFHGNDSKRPFTSVVHDSVVLIVYPTS